MNAETSATQPRGTFRTPRKGAMGIYFSLGAMFGAWVSRIPYFKETFALDERTLGLILLGMAAGAIISFPFSAALTERLGGARLSRYAAVGNAGALVLTGLALSPAMLAGGLMLLGFAGGVQGVAVNAWGGTIEKRLGKPIMSSLHAMFSVGAGLGTIIGAGAVTLGLPPAVHFPLYAAIVLAPVLWLALVPWTRSSPAARRSARPRLALPPPALWLVGIITFCAMICEGGIADWGALLLLETTVASEAQAALGFTVFSVLMVAIRLVGDGLVARFGPVNAARLGAIVAAGGILLSSLSGLVWAAFVGFALMGAGFALLVPLTFSRAAAEDEASAGAAIAGVSTIGHVGLLLGPVMIGFVADVVSLRVSFALLAILPLTIALMATRLKPAGA